MTHQTGRIDDFGMDTISLAGPLPAKLRAIREAGFSQVMLSARDLVGHEQGVDAAIAAVRKSGLRVTGFQVLRDFEGLSGQMHEYKVDIAKVVDAAIAHEVIIELNASPWRLDMDWREWRNALGKGLLCSINPDAHEGSGLEHVRAGINAARKAGMVRSQCLNTRPLKSLKL